MDPNSVEIKEGPEELAQIKASLASLRSDFDSLSGRIDQMIESGAEKVLSTFTIQNGQGMVITGQGRGITIGKQPGNGYTVTWTIVCNGDSTMTGTLIIPGLD